MATQTAGREKKEPRTRPTASSPPSRNSSCPIARLAFLVVLAPTCLLSGRDFLQRLNDLELLVFWAAGDAVELGVHVHQRPAQFLDLLHLCLDELHRWLDCLLVP